MPQGSILGPLLFLFYINDLHNCSKILKFILFADDTTVLFAHKKDSSYELILNRELEALSVWFTANRLSLNVSKTKLVIFGSKNCNLMHVSLNIRLNRNSLEKSNVAKFLGIDIDSNLCWKSHISKVQHKIARVIGILYKIRYKINTETTLLIYNALIMPHLNYCNMSWSSTYKTNLNGIFSLQKRALKLCSDIAMVNKNLFVANNQLDIYKLNDYHTSVFMYKYINGLLPQFLGKFYEFNAEVHHHYTRSNKDIHVTYARTNIKKFIITYRGPQVWNTLPGFLKCLPSLSCFKKQLKLHFLKQ